MQMLGVLAKVSVVPVQVPFTVKENPSTLLEITAADGKRWTMRIQIAVLSVVDNQQPNPNVPGHPTLAVSAALVATTEPVGGT